MAKLNSGTRVYGTATIDSNLAVGSVGAVSGQFHTVTGNISQTTSGGAVYFNTSGNISAAILTAGQINTTGNILATGAVVNALTVNGVINSTGNILSTGAIHNNVIVNTGNINAVGGYFVGNGAFLSGIVSGGGFAGNTSIYVSGNVTAIMNGGTSGIGNIGATGATFNTVFAKSTQAQYADLAEVYTSDKKYVPGTVLIFGGDKEVTISTQSHDPRIAGVVSTNPAYLMNNAETGVPVALQGRVPCRVLGPVEQGDRVVSSHIPGVAQRLDLEQYQPGCIIGKALQTIDSIDISIIEVVVGRV